jgi:alpha/beta superfamily hydrolase
MKKKDNNSDEMLPEYDFSGGVRGKYASRLAEENGYIKIDPLVAKYFKKPEDINKILIAIINSFPLKGQTAL